MRGDEGQEESLKILLAAPGTLRVRTARSPHPVMFHPLSLLIQQQNQLRLLLLVQFCEDAVHRVFQPRPSEGGGRPFSLRRPPQRCRPAARGPARATVCT